jgi:acyl-coenzyme A synthetase/AMP-(fatty) acid ligase
MTPSLRLSQIDPAFRSGPVAFRRDRAVDWSDFVSDVEALAAAIGSQREGHRWVLYTEDTYAFAVGLVALWQSGATAVVPPDLQPATIARAGIGARGTITDGPITVPGLPTLRPSQVPEVSAGHRWSWRKLDPGAPRLELFTSGTTGSPKGVAKTLSQLDAELDGLEERWGEALHERRIFATVSHHHIYGLLFRLLWPLRMGRPFAAQTFLHEAELVPRLIEADRAALVAAPVHLRRLARAGSFLRLGSACAPIFSSGGPLDGLTADTIAGALGAAPIEVFGSTETGGVAWRQQEPGPDRLTWTLFPHVQARSCPPENRLLVSSSLVSAPDSTWLMGDRGCVRSGRLELMGRDDRMVKIGEKRVSLPDLEDRLREHHLVVEAAGLRLERKPEPRIAVAVVLSPEGLGVLSREGRRAVSTILRRHLQPHVDPVALPRVWRYVDRLPLNEQGKLPADTLRQLFDAATPVTAAEVLAERRGERECERTLRVPAQLACLEGHFPGFPVVPGVVQLRWVTDTARSLSGSRIHLTCLEALKFKTLLRPGQVFRLRVQLTPDGTVLHFKLWSGDSVFASGRARLLESCP